MENKFIVDKQGKTGRMKLFNEIDSEGYTSERFLTEFESLQADDSIDEIEILINSLGGAVYKGFPIITAINNSTKPVITVVDTIAASLAALIFLAGSKRKLHSYSQLMLHPARYTDGSTDDALVNTNQSIFDLVKAVTKRAKDKVKSWLNPAKDTWFSASQALENNLATEIINSKLSLANDYQMEVRQLVASASSIETINNLKTKYEQMENIHSVLGLQPEASASEMETKIKEIQNALAIKTLEVTNREEKITDLEAKLKIHEDVEKAKRENEINTLVEDAFKGRQINADGKATWKQLLTMDFESASKAIKALAKTEKISEIINTDSPAVQPVVALTPLQEMMVNPF